MLIFFFFLFFPFSIYHDAYHIECRAVVSSQYAAIHTRFLGSFALFFCKNIDEMTVPMLLIYEFPSGTCTQYSYIYNVHVRFEWRCVAGYCRLGCWSLTVTTSEKLYYTDGKYLISFYNDIRCNTKLPIILQKYTRNRFCIVCMKWN